MTDADEAAAIVNALQRHATVVVPEEPRRGLRPHGRRGHVEGAACRRAAVGGIVDQVVAGETGVLVDDPHDLAAFGGAVQTLLQDPAQAVLLGQNGRKRAVDHFLGDRHLEQYADLFGRIADTRFAAPA